MQTAAETTAAAAARAKAEVDEGEDQDEDEDEDEDEGAKGSDGERGALGGGALCDRGLLGSGAPALGMALPLHPRELARALEALLRLPADLAQADAQKHADGLKLVGASGAASGSGGSSGGGGVSVSAGGGGGAASHGLSEGPSLGLRSKRFQLELLENLKARCLVPVTDPYRCFFAVTF